MIYNLVQHKADRSQLEVGVVARLEQSPNILQLNYQLSGNLENLVLPTNKQKIKKTDNLWQNTCFEAFFKLKGSPNYIELNLSPFSAYNAYCFNAYRQGMQEIDITKIELNSIKTANQYSFDVEIEFAEDYNFESLAITAILMLESGETSHWALKHAADKPDFHLLDSFILL